MDGRKRKNSNGESSSSSSSSNGSNEKKLFINSWSNLSSGVLVNIFKRLEEKELFWVISLVCRSWQLACWEILFWLNYRQNTALNLGNLPDLCYDPKKENYDLLDIALRRLIRSVYDGNGDMFNDIPFCKSIYVDVVLPLGQFSDKYLIYVAERTPKLQMVTIDMHAITGKGFSRSIRNWRQLEEITMQSLSISHFAHVIQEIGINCGRLEIFNIYSCSEHDRSRLCLDEYNSQVIADNLCSLRMFEISDCYINKGGLRILMSKCKQLEKLCLDLCIRALEDDKLTRRRGALNTRQFKVILTRLSVTIQKCERSGSEWFINKVPGKHNVRSIINHLWTEVEDTPTSG